jgi:phage shock protein A
MEIKNLEQALKLQKDFNARLMQSVETLRQGKAPSLDAMLKDKEKLIAQAQTQLESAIKERDAAMARWDERIARLKGDTTQLQAEVADIKNRVAEYETRSTPGERRIRIEKKKRK